MVSRTHCAQCDIRHTSICACLNGEQRRQFEDIVIPKQTAPNTTILWEGDPAVFRFNVTSGAVKLHKLLPDGRRQIVGFVFAGNVLGLGLDNTYAYSAESIGEVGLCRIERRQFDRFANRSREFKRRLLAQATMELTLARDQILLLGRKTPIERIASFLIRVAARQFDTLQHTDDSEVIDEFTSLPMPRLDIADFLGLTNETVSRTLTQLRTARIIRLIGNNRFQIVNQNILENLAAGLGENNTGFAGTLP